MRRWFDYRSHICIGKSLRSIQAVERLSKLKDLLAKYVEKVPSSLVNLLEGMFCFDALKSLTTREGLQHPLFQESLRP
ncbi:hypothetical protein GOP47_0006452 [Adiantum capillus-veneris]|uniref:Uncharacterized protein n=1 Tax=Adiantum capillus-veneris TaxID=13818 RepID=A0A9D4V2X0_ADICA|nr:hypothetical protein GOP47_0006452 [Adiantum capillus-veneris]